MSQKISPLGSRENEFLLSMSANGKQIFRLPEARKFWGSPHNTRIALHRLMSKRWLLPIERGVYLIVPFEAGKEQLWTKDPYLVASELSNPSAISYWSAIRHWNWTEQVPRIVYVQTTRRRNTLRPVIFGVQYEFVVVNKKKFFGHVAEWREGHTVLITDKEKTLIDCADDVERAGTIEELAKAIKAGVPDISWPKFHEYLSRFPNGAVKKRLGFLIETLVANLPPQAKPVLHAMQSSLTAGIVPLQPSKSDSGRISARWRVRVNARLG
jgi:predicted transcriptional regulator of viral defense system